MLFSCLLKNLTSSSLKRMAVCASVYCVHVCVVLCIACMCGCVEIYSERLISLIWRVRIGCTVE